MRLLNTSTLLLENFVDEQHAPPYAILSHRWGDDEVLLQDWQAGSKKESAGCAKVVNACRIAKAHYRYLWCDTICIDKTSSAELSESINSMFEYYARSQTCYAYLRDVKEGLTPEQTNQALQQSEWFSRGWVRDRWAVKLRETLQELLAPRNVVFLHAAWTSFGTKTQLARTITRATGIPEWYLERPDQIQFASVAARMSWAARRVTTRREDMAYCLLGLFNINMPLLYGERGDRAFFRLQIEIAKSTDDESIFAWTAPTNQPCGMFAPWPSAFANFGNVKALYLDAEDRLPYQWTNKGLELHLAYPLNTSTTMTMGWSLLDNSKYGEPHKVVTLGCFKSDTDVDMRDPKAVKKASKGNIICIELQRVGARWKRVNADHVLVAKEFERYSSGYFKGGVAQAVYYVAQ